MSTTEDELDGVKISPTFYKSDADVILISNDDVRFHVHKKSLSSYSQFFSDLFDLGENTENGRPKIKLDETSRTLEIALKYCYSGSKADLGVGDVTLASIKFFDKYQISEGLDAVRESFFIDLGQFGCISRRIVFAALFGKKYGYNSLFKRAMQELYVSTDASDLAHLKKSIFDDFREEANLIGFLVSSRVFEFSTLKSNKLQELLNSTAFAQSNNVTTLKVIGEFEKNADYVNLQKSKPDGLVTSTSSPDLNVGYAKAMTELTAELKALEMKF